MRILQLHNRYLLRGGEDVAFECEVALLRAAGCEVETLEFHNADLQALSLWQQVRAFFHNPKPVAVLKERISAFEPELVHVHNFGYYGSPGLLRAVQQMGRPVVMSLHNYRLVCIGSSMYRQGRACRLCVKRRLPLAGIYYRCFQSSWLKSLVLQLATSYHHLRGTFSAVDHYIVPKAYSKKVFLASALGIETKQISVKYNSVPEQATADPSPSKRSPFFLYVGRLSQQKGVDLLLKLAHEANICLEFIGTGPFEKEVAAAAATNTRLVYHGEQPAAFVLERLKRCCALLCPSRWQETGPYVVMEAFVSATPVVCHRLEAIAEIVRDEENGLLCELDDLAAWRDATQRLQQDGALHERLSKGARRSYETYFTHAQNGAALLSIYKKVLAKHGGKCASELS